MGIVVSASQSTVRTIEGNSAKSVRRRSYDLSDGSIAGYASMRDLMDRAGILEEFEALPGTTPFPEAEWALVEREGTLVGDVVNLRLEPTLEAEVGAQLAGGSPVWIESMAQLADGYVWYRIFHEDENFYYVRGDLVELAEEAPEAEGYCVEVVVTPQTARVGDTITFAANVIGQAPEGLSWQWQYSTDKNLWYDIEGATEQTYSVEADMTVFLQYYRVIAVEQREETLLAALEGLLFPAALAEGGEVISAPSQVKLASTGDAIYLNPRGEASYDAQGQIVMAAGSDANDGATAQNPVHSLARAIELAQGKDIICMGEIEVAGEMAVDALGSRLRAYDGDGSAQAALEGAFFRVKSGVLALSNLALAGQEVCVCIEGGVVELGEGLSLEGEILLCAPSEEAFALCVAAPNAVEGGRYAIAFEGAGLQRVALAEGDQTAVLSLSAALAGADWVLAEEAGNTYACLAPAYGAIYLNGETGNDANAGNAPEAAVQTLARAQELLSAHGASVIYVTGTVTIDAEALCELAVPGEASARVVRDASCDQAMFRVVDGAYARLGFDMEDENGGEAALVEVTGGEVELAGDVAGALRMTGGEATLYGRADSAVVESAGAALRVMGGVGTMVLEAEDSTVTIGAGAQVEAAELLGLNAYLTLEDASALEQPISLRLSEANCVSGRRVATLAGAQGDADAQGNAAALAQTRSTAEGLSPDAAGAYRVSRAVSEAAGGERQEFPDLH